MPLGPQVGTESSLDRSKSIKSHLLRLFAGANGSSSIDGVDCIHGCYGAVAALFNAVAWVESSAWDGRLAIVVATDVAVSRGGCLECCPRHTATIDALQGRGRAH